MNVLAILLLCSIHTAVAWPLRAPPARNYTVSITDFGAKGDGVTVNTQAIERAVAAVAANGEGQIVVPAPGTFVTAPFNLTSHSTLYLEAGAILLGAGFWLTREMSRGKETAAVHPWNLEWRSGWVAGPGGRARPGSPRLPEAVGEPVRSTPPRASVAHCVDREPCFPPRLR